jgi:hypothetical protein
MEGVAAGEGDGLAAGAACAAVAAIIASAQAYKGSAIFIRFPYNGYLTVRGGEAQGWRRDSPESSAARTRSPGSIVQSST